MKKLRSIFVDNRHFFVAYFCIFLVGLLILLAEGNAASFFFLNPYHRSILDSFFIRLTFLGDGLFALSVILIFLIMRRFSRAVQMMVAFLTSALLAQVLKSFFSMPRPKQFFNPGDYAYFIDGVTLVGYSSFPSGHTTSIFTLATLLALFEKNKKWNILYLPPAVAVGYSRIYLGQHFLRDVLMGSLIGVLTAVLVHWLFAEKFDSWRGFSRA